MDSWSNEKVIEFLELYAAERAIWNPSDVNHKNKHRVQNAWERLSSRMNIPVDELKAKKRSLMATFRPLLKRKKASIKAGAEDEDVMQPIWFAFDVMESFLGPLYDSDGAAVEEEPEPQTKYESRNAKKSTNTPKTDDANKTTPKPTVTVKRPEHVTPSGPSYSEIELAKANINECFKTLNQALNERKKDDECDLYAKLLAKKLRKYPEEMRLRLMYKIDGFLIDNPYPNEESPSNYSSPAYRDDNSPSPVYVNVKSEIPPRRGIRRKRIHDSGETVLPGTSSMYESSYMDATSDEDDKE